MLLLRNLSDRRCVSDSIRRAGSRRVMMEPWLLVWEAFTEQLEERQSDWAYSRTVVFLDTLLNLAFVAAAAGVLVLSRDEAPSMPLRLWIGGYALQCVLFIVCVCVRFQRRHLQRDVEERSSHDRGGLGPSSPSDVVEARGCNADQAQNEEARSVAKDLEFASNMFSCIWWFVGFYCVSAGGQALIRDAPQLYWLCIVFLAFDCIGISIAVCCCVCIINIVYVVTDQQGGASDEDIRQLPTYKFRRIDNSEILFNEVQRSKGGMMIECGSDEPIEHVLSAEDAVCCICLFAYKDGVELRVPPCRHHFHCACIDKWLYINATCPLCKYNIV
ncbi:E3 ubiquitin-protein ligase At1g12760-like [Musa acuminata AAA Group]|uniref:E3 ubiquitin-protein ligase At1g12760-like n=1 Tax=Musa acuminata AAA Group TaxID=214697 RepID=UPI0031E19E8E